MAAVVGIDGGRGQLFEAEWNVGPGQTPARFCTYPLPFRL